MNSEKKWKAVKKADILLCSVLVVLAISSFLCYRYFYDETGTYVEVSVNGTTMKSFPLEKNTTYEIKDSEGGTNILHIKNHKAYIKDANCPDKLCVHQKAISKVGESLICLPHKVVVTITNSTN